MKTIYCNDFLKDLKEEDFSQGTSVTMGNFDGCHLAHKEILLKTKNLALASKSISVVLTFFPHPRDFFFTKSSSLEEKRLFSLKQKLEATEACGIDCVIVQSFQEEFSHLSHEDFYTLLLKKKLHAKNIVIGSNFCFGRERLGTSTWLAEEGLKDSVAIHPLPLMEKDGTPVNSTQVRACLSVGEVEKAKRLLGNPFYMDGIIAKGNQMGRKFGFPTANFSQIEQIIPARGVYSGFLRVLKDSEEKEKAVVINIGFRPTVVQDAKQLIVEAHCFDIKESELSLYGKKCRLFFHHRLRSEKKFSSLDELKKQIEADIHQARSLS